MNVTVEEYTSLSPITINLNAELSEANRLMKENEIRHLPVLEDGVVVGIISERDLLANDHRSWSEGMRVKNIMSTSILTAFTNDSLGDVAFRLSKEKKGSAIIYEPDNSFYGIFTTTDALNALVELLFPDK